MRTKKALGFTYGGGGQKKDRHSQKRASRVILRYSGDDPIKIFQDPIFKDIKQIQYTNHLERYWLVLLRYGSSCSSSSGNGSKKNRKFISKSKLCSDLALAGERYNLTVLVKSDTQEDEHCCCGLVFCTAPPEGTLFRKLLYTLNQAPDVQKKAFFIPTNAHSTECRLTTTEKTASASSEYSKRFLIYFSTSVESEVVPFKLFTESAIFGALKPQRMEIAATSTQDPSSSFSSWVALLHTGLKCTVSRLNKCIEYHNSHIKNVEAEGGVEEDDMPMRMIHLIKPVLINSGSAALEFKTGILYLRTQTTHALWVKCISGSSSSGGITVPFTAVAKNIVYMVAMVFSMKQQPTPDDMHPLFLSSGSTSLQLEEKKKHRLLQGIVTTEVALIGGAVVVEEQEEPIYCALLHSSNGISITCFAKKLATQNESSECIQMALSCSGGGIFIKGDPQFAEVVSYMKRARKHHNNNDGILLYNRWSVR